MNALERDTLKFDRVPMCPDCQQFPAVHCAAGEYWCDPCDQYVRKVRAVIEDNIRRRNQTDETMAARVDKTKEYYRLYYQLHKAKMNAQHRAYEHRRRESFSSKNSFGVTTV
jgi:hypothetical protein